MKQKLLLAALSAAGPAASLAAEPAACMDITLDGIPRFPSDASKSIQAALDKVRAAGGEYSVSVTFLLSPFCLFIPVLSAFQNAIS